MSYDGLASKSSCLYGWVRCVCLETIFDARRVSCEGARGGREIHLHCIDEKDHDVCDRAAPEEDEEDKW